MELGGGLRTLDTIRAYLDLGLDRLILGTVVLKDPDLAARACAEFPGKIAIGLDAKDGLLAVEGWTETSRRTALEVAKVLEPLKPAAIIYTDIARDGVKQGVNISAPPGPWPRPSLFRSSPPAGSAPSTDIEALLPLEAVGVVGVITGRALYDGSLDLAEAIKLAQKD